MQQALINGSTEIHVTASLAVRSILEEKALSVDLFARSFLHTITQAMDNRDPAVATSWSETLVEAVKVLPNNLVQAEITPVALSRAQLIKPVGARISSCKLIGEIAKKYDAQLVRKDLIPTVLSLCQDVNGEVRAEMAKQLSSIAQQLGPELAKSHVSQLLIELSSDELTIVKENTFQTIVETLQNFPPETLKSVILPLMKQIIVLAFKMDDNLLITISKLFGQMCKGIDKYVSNSEKELYIKWYITMTTMGITQVKKEPPKGDKKEPEQPEAEISATHRYTECRENCALSFPAMAKFSYDLSPKAPLDYLHSTLKNLISDPCYIVRKAIATGFHEVCLVFWKQCPILKEEFITLCRDDSVDVLDGFIPNLYTIMELFLHNNVFKSEPQNEVLTQLLRTLVKSEGTLARGYKWRSYLIFLKQTRHFYRFVPSDMLYGTLILCYMKIVHSSRVVPVRLGALKNLLLYMRYTSRFQHRKEIKDKIITEFCQSKNFYDRILYVRVLPTILDLFSTNYFKEYFYLKSVRLFDDPVANVRCGLVKLLPKFKLMLKLPTDAKLHTIIDSATSKLTDEKDSETKRVLLAVTQSGEDTDAGKLFPDDQKKYEEEKKLFFERKDDHGGVGGVVAQRGKGPGVPARPTVKPPSATQPQPKKDRQVSPGTSVSTGSPKGGGGFPSTTSHKRDGGPPTRQREMIKHREMSGQEKEFYIDAGVHLPEGVQKIPIIPAFNNNNINNNSTLKKWDTTHRIPVRRPINQRHSLQITTDFNKNITSSAVLDKPLNITRNNNYRSHLPRPLSCINFQTAKTTKSDSPTTSPSSTKQRHISKLPVVNRSLSELQNAVRRS